MRILCVSGVNRQRPKAGRYHAGCHAAIGKRVSQLLNREWPKRVPSAKKSVEMRAAPTQELTAT